MSKNIKDKKVEIFHDIGKNDGFNHNHEWESRGKYWAYTRMLSMYEYQNYGLDIHEITRLFILNYHEEIRPKDIIVYRDKEYRITSIDTLDDNKQDIKIYATLDKIPRVQRK